MGLLTFEQRRLPVSTYVCVCGTCHHWLSV